MLLKGNAVSDRIKDGIVNSVKNHWDSDLCIPKLAIIRIGERADDIAYETGILKNCAKTGIKAEVIVVNNNVSTVDFLKTLNKINENKEIHGILVLRPLPEQLDHDTVNRAISLEKDIDCMNPLNMEKVFAGNKSVMPPCTAEAVIALLKHYEIDLPGKKVVIVNRSMVLGKPLAMLFLAENATVTICHSKTKNLFEITRKADIVVTGIGRCKFFGKEYFSKESIVVDAGIDEENGNLCGDVDFEETAEYVSAISPVPGGVGPITSMILLSNVIKAMKLQQGCTGKK